MASFINNITTNTNGIINSNKNTCKLSKAVLPSFTPIVNNFSVTSSIAGQYSLVYINGSNFFPNGITYINFGPYQNIPVTYYGSFNISFVVPTNAPPGNYNVFVVNLYNGQFSTPVRYTYPGNLNYSTPVTYSLT